MNANLACVIFPSEQKKHVFYFRMKNRVLFSLLATLCALRVADAATVSWRTSPGVLDTEVSRNGTQVFGYYFNSAAGLQPTAIVNTVPFTLQQSPLAPLGLDFNGSYNNNEMGGDLYEVPLGAGNAGLNQILDGQNWGTAASLIVTGLTPGRQYELQFMISDDRQAFFNGRNYDVSDNVDPEGSRDIERAYHSTRGGGVPAAAPAGSVEAKIFTGSFTADASGTQGIYNVLYNGTDHNAADAGSQVNAIQVRLIPEPTTLALAVLGLGLFCRRRPA